MNKLGILLALIILGGSLFACDINISQSDFPYTASVANSMYCMNESITVDSADAFTVGADNVTLDCVAFEINTTTTGKGIVSNWEQTRIQNCYINAVETGISITHGQSYYLENIYSYGEMDGLYLHGSYGSYVNQSNFYGKRFGIYIDNSDSTIIENSYAITDHTYGNTAIQISQSPYTTLRATQSEGTLGLWLSPYSKITNDWIYYDSGIGIDVTAGTNNSLFMGNEIVTGGYCIQTIDSGDTYLENNCTSDYWVSDLVGGNYYNNTTVGNIYYFANGTPSWDIYDITADAGTWANGGADRPFYGVLPEWLNLGQDWHPYTLNSGAILTSCGGITSTVAVNYEVFDLSTNTLIPYSITNVISQFTSANFTGSGNSTSNYTLCVFPDDGTAFAQISDTVTSPNYFPIQWFHEAKSYSSAVTNYTVYLTPFGNYSKQTQIFVVDANLAPMLNVSVKIEQINPITSISILLGSFLVDSFGITTQALQPATQLYHFTVTDINGTILQDFPNQAIPCASTELICQIVLVVNPATNVGYVDTFGNIYATCTWSNVTGNLSCTPVGVLPNVTNLGVSMVNSTTFNASICNQSGIGLNTVTCMLPTTPGNCYNFAFGAILTTGESQQLAGGQVCISNPPAFVDRSGIGLIITFVLVATLALLGLAFGPSGTFLGASFGLLIAIGIGFLTGIGFYAGIMGVLGLWILAYIVR